MKILITGGGSEEPIDNVRFISNFSSGKTASFLADYFAEKGFKVTAIMAQKAVKPCEKVRIFEYRTFLELKEKLEKECKSGEYGAIIHAAAVSDYSPSSVFVDSVEYKAGEVEKLPAGAELVIKMRKNPKLLDALKGWCSFGNEGETHNDGGTGKDGGGVVIGFKLTSRAGVEERKIAVKKIFSSNENPVLAPDYIISNDLSEIIENVHPYNIYRRDLSVFENGITLNDLAHSLEKIICKKDLGEKNGN